MSDILKVVSKYVKLEKSGKNFIGICPFHDEETPSFVVNPREESYHCYGCNENGDAEKFLKEFLTYKTDLNRFLIDYDFDVAYGSEEDNFNKKTFELMRLVFEAGWRMSRLKNI